MKRTLMAIGFATILITLYGLYQTFQFVKQSSDPEDCGCDVQPYDPRTTFSHYPPGTTWSYTDGAKVHQ